MCGGEKLPGWSRPLWIGRAMELAGLDKGSTDAKGAERQRAPSEGACGQEWVSLQGRYREEGCLRRERRGWGEN